MESNSYFGTIKEFYAKNTFCDLKIISVQCTQGEVESTSPTSCSSGILCHSIVLFSAIPELRSYISDYHTAEEDMLTLFVDNSDADDIKSAISDIYDALVSTDADKRSVDRMAVQHWAKAFGISSCNDIFSRRHINQEPDVQKQSLNSTSDLLRKPNSSININGNKHHLGTENIQNIPDEAHQAMNTDKKISNLLKNGSIEHETDVEKSITNSNSNSIHGSTNNPNVEESTVNSTNTNIESLTSEPMKLSETAKCEPISAINPTDKQNLHNIPAEKTGSANSQIGPVKKEYKEKTCIDCSQKFPFNTKGQKSAYQVHISSHFKCDCNITFGDRKAFKLHMKTNHKGKAAKTGQTGANNDVNKIKTKKDKPTFR